jgi:hypothetical protein
MVQELTMRTAAILLLLASLALAQTNTPAPGKAPAPAPAPAAAENDISGMYTFLRDGEFVQVNLEDGRVTGFLSRYDNEEKNPANFVDQFFDKASLDGKQLSFTTKKVHGISFDFQGTAERGPGKTRADEGYFVLKGTLTETVTDAAGNPSSRSRAVEFKSFPADVQGTDAAPN